MCDGRGAKDYAFLAVDRCPCTETAGCLWPAGGRFKVYDPEPDNHHSALYVVLPDGLCVNVSGHDGEGVDIARAHFIADACNAALASVDGRRMAETRSGSGRSPTSAVPAEEQADAQTPTVHP